MMPEYILPEVVGKLICGVLAVVIARVIFVRNKEQYQMKE